MSYRKASGDRNSCENLKYMFVVEWYDPVAQIVKKFLMTLFTAENSVELYDLHHQRIFLKKCKQEGIDLINCYKNAIITIMSRQMKIVDYADANTKLKFEVELSHTFCLVKPDIVHKAGEIINFMHNQGLKIIKMKMGRMSKECASDFYKEHSNQTFMAGLMTFMSTGPCIAMEVIGEDAVNRWRDYIGPMDAEVAKKEAPHTLRAIYGTDIIRNAVHGSKDAERVKWEADVWFLKEKANFTYILPTCVLKNTTCCIIKPHAVLEGSLGLILNYINSNNFKITAMEMFSLDVSTAEEFLEVYKGVVPEYSAMVVQLTSGPSVALEIMDLTSPECSHATFRKLAGPTDPEIARKLRPDTIRAKFGKDKVLNAVHCTDLPDDAPLEVEYFFKVLQV